MLKFSICELKITNPYCRGSKISLFTFEGSLHSINLSETNENLSKDDAIASLENILTIEPNARLVIEIYQPLMSFVDEINVALGCHLNGCVLIP